LSQSIHAAIIAKLKGIILVSQNIKLTRYTDENLDEALVHIYQMAIELRKADELTAVSFLVTNNLLIKQSGCFYTATIDGKLAGYACFSFGTTNPDLRRLYYFAVPSNLQGLGLGSLVLKSIINSELTKPNGALTVACQPGLASFYEKLGFTNTGECKKFEGDGITEKVYYSQNEVPDVLLVYSHNPNAIPSSIIDEDVSYIPVDLGELVPHLPSVEKNFEIDLTSDLPQDMKRLLTP
jgi:predicted GNAT family N-acyltransferase